MTKKDIFNFIKNNSINQVKKWLDLYPNDIHSKDNAGYTPLHRTCYENNLKITKLLIDKGADINYKNNRGQTALHWASYNGELEIVKLLINKGADIHSKDNVGKTPLHKASYYGRLEIAKLLIDKGADFNCEDKYGKIPLDYLNDEDRNIINKYIRYIKLDSKIISLSQIQL